MPKTATVDEIPAAWERIRARGLYTSRSNTDCASSEMDDFAPTEPIVFFGPLAGGEVRADVLGEDRTTEAGDLLGDPWTYDIGTGVELTAAEVADLIGEEG